MQKNRTNSLCASERDLYKEFVEKISIILDETEFSTSLDHFTTISFKENPEAKLQTYDKVSSYLRNDTKNIIPSFFTEEFLAVNCAKQKNVELPEGEFRLDDTLRFLLFESVLDKDQSVLDQAISILAFRIQNNTSYVSVILSVMHLRWFIQCLHVFEKLEILSSPKKEQLLRKLSSIDIDDFEHRKVISFFHEHLSLLKNLKSDISGGINAYKPILKLGKLEVYVLDLDSFLENLNLFIEDLSIVSRFKKNKLWPPLPKACTPKKRSKIQEFFYRLMKHNIIEGFEYVLIEPDFLNPILLKYFGIDKFYEMFKDTRDNDISFINKSNENSATK